MDKRKLNKNTPLPFQKSFLIAVAGNYKETPNTSLVFEQLMLFNNTFTLMRKSCVYFRHVDGFQDADNKAQQLTRKSAKTKHMWLKTNKTHNNLSLQ